MTGNYLLPESLKKGVTPPSTDKISATVGSGGEQISNKGNFFNQGERSYLVEQRDNVGFEGIDNINLDTELWFKLRGHSLNPLIDASTPLFGLVLRLRNLTENEAVEPLYNRIKTEMAALDEEIRQRDYDRATQIAFHYCLCTFIDEAVMGTPWGLKGMWTQCTLLNLYHNEAWGGEKFFIILNRMKQDPQQHQDMLELFYLMLSLGFRGRYGAISDGHSQLNDIIRKLHRQLREVKGDSPEHLLPDTTEIHVTKYHLNRQIPLWSIWASLSLVLVATYAWYSLHLSREVDNAIEQLSNLLR